MEQLVTAAIDYLHKDIAAFERSMSELETLFGRKLDMKVRSKPSKAALGEP